MPCWIGGGPVKLAQDYIFFDMAELNTTLPETNSSPLKMDGWKTSFLLGCHLLRGYVSFRECIHSCDMPWIFRKKTGSLPTVSATEGWSEYGQS